MAEIGEDPDGMLGVLLDGLQDGVAVFGADGRLKAYNDSYVRLFRLRPGDVYAGQPLEELFGRLWERDSLHPHLTREEAVAKRLATWGTPADRRERRYMTGGRVLDMFRSRTEAGDIVTVTVDVTAACAQERALEMQRIYTDSILRNILEAVALVDAHGTFIAFNDRLLDLFAIDRALAKRDTPTERMLALSGDLARLAPADRAAATEMRRRFLLNDEERMTERLPGCERVLDYRKALLPTGGSVLTIRDITAEIARARASDEARLRAEASSRDKSVFLARMSHELRTPMNGVLGTAALLAETELTERQRTLADVIRSSGDLMVRLIDDVLDMAAIDAGGITLREEPFAICRVMRESIALIEPEARRKGLWLRKDPSPIPVPELLGDPVRIKQILLNLLGNAVKFTETGGITVGLRIAPSDRRCRCVIRISDTGVGIPESERAAIFQQFYQIDSSMTRRSGGAGLGLTISERLLSAMGGRMDLASVPGQGTTFEVVVDLPRAGSGIGAARVAG